MGRPFGRPDPFSVQHQRLLAKGRQQRGHVDQRDPVPLRRADHPTIPCADVCPARFDAAANVAHGLHAPADARPSFQDLHRRAVRFERERRRKPRKPCADDDNVPARVRAHGPGAAAGGAPHRAGLR